MKVWFVSLVILLASLETAAQEKERKFDFPYVSAGTSVVHPFKEFNIEVGMIKPWQKDLTIRPSISLNRAYTSDLEFRNSAVTYAAGYVYEVKDYSIDFITRGLASIEIGQKLNERFELLGGYAVGVLISSEGMVTTQEGYDAQDAAGNFNFTSNSQSSQSSFVNDFTGLRRGQHFLSLGAEYSLKEWLRIGYRSRLGLLDQTKNDIYADDFTPLSSHSFNLILDF